MMVRLRRITLDWDFKNPIYVMYAIHRCLKYLSGKQGEQLIIKMSSKKGYHIFLWTRKKGTRFNIRKELFDDQKHLSMDKLHKFGKQTLFHIKKKFRK